MEGYTFPCLFEISVFLDMDDMKALACVNKQLMSEMTTIMNDQSLWKCKTGNILCITISTEMYKINWKLAYDTLSPTCDPRSLLYSNNKDLINLALFAGAWSDEENDALVVACKEGNLDVVDDLLQNAGMNACIPDYIIVRCCCLLSSPEILEILSKPKRQVSDITCMDKPLHIMSQLLRDPKADIGTYNNLVFPDHGNDNFQTILDRISQNDLIYTDSPVFWFIWICRALHIINKIHEHKKMNLEGNDGFDIIKDACTDFYLHMLSYLSECEINALCAANAFKSSCTRTYSAIAESLLLDSEALALLTKEELSTCISCI